MRVGVTPIPVVPPRAVSIAPPELDRAAPLPPTRDQGWGNSRPPAPADQRAERQRRSRRVFTPSAPFNRPWTFARKPARRGSKCVASSGQPHSSRATEENSKRRKTAKHWYRPELVAWYRLKSVFGVLLLTSSNDKVEPQNLGLTQSASSQHTKKHDTYPTCIEKAPTAFSTRAKGHILRLSRVRIVSAIFSWLVEQDRYVFSRSARPPDPRARRRYLSVFPSRSARST